MTRAGAESAVVCSALIVGGMYAYRKLTEPAIAAAGGHRQTGSKATKAVGAGSPAVPVGKFMVGFSFAYLCLAFVAVGLPDLAGALAILLALAAVFAQGNDVFNDITEATA